MRLHAFLVALVKYSSMLDTPVFFIRDPAKFPHFIHVRIIPMTLIPKAYCANRPRNAILRLTFAIMSTPSRLFGTRFSVNSRY